MSYKTIKTNILTYKILTYKILLLINSILYSNAEQ
jgi:hypothetical protein